MCKHTHEHEPYPALHLHHSPSPIVSFLTIVPVVLLLVRTFFAPIIGGSWLFNCN